MLGCWVSKDKSGGIVVNPTEANWQKLKGRMRLQSQRVYAKLSASKKDNDDGLRIEGLQDFLRLESICQGWIEAFEFCGEHIKCVEDHYYFEIGLIRQIFDITQEELQPLKDPSTKVKIKWYSGK